MHIKRSNVRNYIFHVFLFLSFIMIAPSCVKIKNTGHIPSADSYPQSNSVRAFIINQSHRKIGVPYLYGGSTINGFDCSGLTQYVYKEAGINIPRTTKLQLRESQTVSYQNLLPGDLVFYKTSTTSRHVGIYIGNNQMIHASTGSKQVRTASITTNYWRQRFTKFGRFIKNN